MIWYIIIITIALLWVYLFLYLNVNNGLCEFSEKYFNIHDYPIDKGGDGIPNHFHTYRCHKCGKSFTI